MGALTYKDWYPLGLSLGTCGVRQSAMHLGESAEQELNVNKRIVKKNEKKSMKTSQNESNGPLFLVEEFCLLHFGDKL